MYLGSVVVLKVFSFRDVFLSTSLPTYLFFFNKQTVYWSRHGIYLKENLHIHLYLYFFFQLSSPEPDLPMLSTYPVDQNAVN